MKGGVVKKGVDWGGWKKTEQNIFIVIEQVQQKLGLLLLY